MLEASSKKKSIYIKRRKVNFCWQCYRQFFFHLYKKYISMYIIIYIHTVIHLKIGIYTSVKFESKQWVKNKQWGTINAQFYN